MISHGFGPAGEALLASLARKSLDENTRFSESVFGGTRVIHSHPLIRDSKTGGHHCFDGSVVSRSVYVNYFKRPTELDIAEIVDAPTDLAGVFALVSIDPGGDVVTMLDELSQYCLFYHSDGKGRHVIANNPYLIESYLEADGTRPARSVDGFVASLVWNSAVWGGGGYEDISLIGHNEILSIRGGVFDKTRRPEVRPLEYREAVARTASALRDSLRTLDSNRQGIDAYYDITGGKDSRMVFAALESVGLHRTFSCSTLFRHPHPDGHYASFLAESFDLNAHEYKTYGFDESGPYAMRHEKEHHLPHCKVFTSFGLNAGMAMFGKFQEPDVMRVSGGHGELGGSSPDVKRSNGRGTGKDSGPAALAENYIRTIGQLGHADYLSRELRDSVGERTRNIFARVERDLFNGNEASQLIYNQGRNRTHFTLISYMRNRFMHYPDVLCMRSLQDAGRWLSVGEKDAGKANFDVIHALGGSKAVSIPLAEKPWSDLADPNGLSGRDCIDTPEPKRFSEPLLVTHPQERTRFEVEPGLSGLTRDKRLAVYHQREVSKALSEGNPIIDAFDAAKLASLVDTEVGQLRGKHLRVLETVATGAIWMSRSERTSRFAPHPAHLLGR